MHRLFLELLKLTVVLTLSLNQINAEPHSHGRTPSFEHQHDWDRHDRENGHWFHRMYNNQPGWWWVVGGIWYFYSQPVYPYPDPYTPPVMVTIPPTDSAVTMPQNRTEDMPLSYWYYCEATHNYYPYVANCKEGWKKVPAIPPAPTSSETDK